MSLNCVCVSKDKKRFIVVIHKANVIGHTNRWIYIYHTSRELVNVARELHDSIKAPADNDAIKKAKKTFYYDMKAVKVVCILNFDSESLAEQLRNNSDVVVNWDICEQKLKQQANPLMAWTFVILPRFEKLLREMKPIDFRSPITSLLCTRGCTC